MLFTLAPLNPVSIPPHRAAKNQSRTNIWKSRLSTRHITCLWLEWLHVTNLQSFSEFSPLEEHLPSLSLFCCVRSKAHIIQVLCLAAIMVCHTTRRGISRMEAFSPLCYFDVPTPFCSMPQYAQNILSSNRSRNAARGRDGIRLLSGRRYSMVMARESPCSALSSSLKVYLLCEKVFEYFIKLTLSASSNLTSRRI